MLSEVEGPLRNTLTTQPFNDAANRFGSKTTGRFMRSCVTSSAGREESPTAGNAFQLVDTEIFKINPGTGDKILHRTRNHNATRLRFRHDSRAGVDRDASDVVAH